MKHINIAYAATAVLAVMLAACQAEQPGTAGAMHPARLNIVAAEAPLTPAGSTAAEAQATPATQDAEAQGATRAAAGSTGFNAANVKFAFSGGNVVNAAGAAVTDVTGQASLADCYLAAGEIETWVDGYLPSTYDYASASTTFSVAQDQTGADGIGNSDLMFGSSRIVRTLNDYSGATAAATLQMRHLMAQLDITVNSPSAAVTAVRVVSGYRTIAIDQARGCRLSSLTTIADHSGLSDEITPSAPVSVFSGTAAAGTPLQVVCLLPPQQLAVSRAVLEVYLQGYTAPVRYRFTADQTLQSGYSYQLNVAPSAPQAGTTVAMTGWSQNTGSTTAPTTAQSAPNTYYVGTQAFKMVPVKGGSFGPYTWPSSTSYTISGTLTDYYIGETEVTNALWKAVMGDLSVPQAHSDAKATKDSERLVTGDTYPVTWVTRDDIIKTTASYTSFIDRLNQLTEGQRPAGYRFCLPSYAQWGYAARGGIHSRGYTYAGGNTASEVMWVNGSSGVLHPVAQLRPNELGLYDMQGNNWEYLQDWHTALTASVSGVTDYSGPATGTKFVVVGYSYSDDVHTLAESYYPNGWLPAEGMNHHCGFRLCLRRVKVGDLYFSDGSWGTLSENPGKTPVGIVFSTATSTADQQRGYRSGYVMALRFAGTVSSSDVPQTFAFSSAALASTNVTTTQITHAQAPTAGRDDLDGLTHCLEARQYVADHSLTMATDLPAINAAMTYDKGAAPAVSSGWYLPSLGQMHSLLQWARGAAPYWSDQTSFWRFCVSSGGDEWKGAASRQAIDTKMTNAGLTAKTHFDPFYTSNNSGSNILVSTSTERDASILWHIYLNGSTYATGTANSLRTDANTVRPVLAF